ncbi:MAG: hypothetical protein U5L04_04620 [Trueperaceae bacterium]|nr:hypothetical protein [Trueperaceae bacterium]
MLELERVALELLEYKVGDLLAKREVPGGAESAWALHNHIAQEQGALDADERQRFQDVSRTLKRLSGVKSQAQVYSFDELELEGFGDDDSDATNDTTAAPSRASDRGDSSDFDFADPFGAPRADPVAAEPSPTSSPPASPPPPSVSLSPAEQQEQQILRKLTERVWWDGLAQVMQNLATTYRAEPERHTVRILFALLRNLGHYVRSDSFADDVTLAHLNVKESVPDYTDPLVSLNDVESIGELIREIAEIALTFKNPRSPYRALRISEDQVLAYLRRFGLAVARDPYAGKLSLSPMRGPSSAQVRIALQELKKEQMREDTKQEQQRKLEARLQQALELERSQRQFFEKDVQRYMEAVDEFFDELERHLPSRVGGRAEWPTLASNKVLFAEHPALRVDKVPTGAKSLTVRLKGPTRFRLGGVEIALLYSGETWWLYVENDEVRLEPDMKLTVAPGRLLVLREKDYIYFEVRDEGLPLAALVAEALVVHTLLEHDSFAAPVKMATGVDIGESQETAQQAFRRLQAIVGNAPEPGEALVGLLQGAARALRQELPDAPLQTLAERFGRALSVEADELGELVEGWQSVRVKLSAEPVSVKLAGYPFTVRKYVGRNSNVPENVVLMAPGRPLGSFFDYLLRPFRDGTLLCARSLNDLVALYLPPAEAPAETSDRLR